MRAVLQAILLFCLIMAVVITVYSLTRRDRLRNVFFTVLCAGVSVYLLGYLLEISSTTMEAALIALKVENAGIPIISPFLLLFVLNVCQYKQFRNWMTYAGILYSFGFFAVVLTNESHYLYYSSITYVPTSGLHYLLLGHGPLYIVQHTFSIACCVTAYAALGFRMFALSPKNRMQMLLLLGGSLFPFLTNVANFVGFVPVYFDPTPVAMSLTLLLGIISLARYNLFDIADVASEAAIQSMDSGVIVVDRSWCYRMSNEAAKMLFPGLVQMMMGDEVADLPGWPDVLSEGAGRRSFTLLVEGKTRYYRAHICLIGKESAPIGWTIMIRDITESTEMMERLNTLATIDSLTGVFNRRHFLESALGQLEHAKREQVVSALAIFDIDHFKRINDTYGHQAGDAVLCMLAETVKRELRAYDIFARYGGEEFTLFIVNIRIDDAEAFAKRLCATIEQMRIPHQDIELRITASFGIVELRWDDSLDNAIRAADEAMYRAKAAGRNRVEVGVVDRKAGVRKLPHIANK